MQHAREGGVLMQSFKLEDDSDVTSLYEMRYIKGMSREEAQAAFLKMGKSPSYFRSTNSKMLDRAVGYFLTGNLNRYTPSLRTYFKILKKFIGSEILLYTGDKIDGVEMARGALQSAERLEIIEICLSISRRLHNYYSNTAPNEGRKNFYLSKVRFYAEELRKEVEIEMLSNEISFYLIEERDVTKYKEQLEGYSAGRFWRYNFFLFKCKVWIAFSENNPDDVTRYSDQALESVKDNKVCPVGTKFNFAYYKIPIQIIHRKFDLAEKSISECLSMYSGGQFNWFMAHYIKAIYGFHSGKVRISLDSYLRCKRAKDRTGSGAIRDRINTIRAYLSLFNKWGDVQFKDSFKLYKFLNDLDSATSKKKGHNVAVLICEMLHLLTDLSEARKKGNIRLVNRKKQKYSEKADTIKRYVRSYLSEDKYKRSKTFLKMLALIEHADYFKARTSKKVHKLKIELHQTPTSINADGLEQELVPFEILWQKAISLLI